MVTLYIFLVIKKERVPVGLLRPMTESYMTKKYQPMVEAAIMKNTRLNINK